MTKDEAQHEFLPLRLRQGLTDQMLAPFIEALTDIEFHEEPILRQGTESTECVWRSTLVFHEPYASDEITRYQLSLAAQTFYSHFTHLALREVSARFPIADSGQADHEELLAFLTKDLLDFITQVDENGEVVRGDEVIFAPNISLMVHLEYHALPVIDPTAEAAPQDALILIQGHVVKVETTPIHHRGFGKAFVPAPETLDATPPNGQ